MMRLNDEAEQQNLGIAVDANTPVSRLILPRKAVSMLKAALIGSAQNRAINSASMTSRFLMATVTARTGGRVTSQSTTPHGV